MADSSAAPKRGEVWDVDLGEPIGHEASSLRPALIVSADRFNRHRLVAICPITRTRKPYPTRVELEPGESGLDVTSYVQAEQVRTLSTARLVRRRGTVNAPVINAVSRNLRLLLEL